MKTTLHYIIAILLLSLNATHAFAEGEEGPFNITYRGDNVTYSYNEEKTLLTIRGDGSITITGDGKPVNCGIAVEYSGLVNLTIKDLHIQAEAALMVPQNSYGNNFTLTLEGTNKLESTKGLVTNAFFAITGPGSLTVQGGEGASAIRMEDALILEGNPILVAIGGKGAEAISRGTLTHDGGLLIQGKVIDGGTIEHTSSVLKGNLTLGTDFEIPSWATVTIPAGQSITVPKDKTLTNKGTLETEEGGTLTNQGSIINEGTLETENGTLVNEGTIEANGIKTSSKFLNIGEEDGFDVSSTSDGVTFSYDDGNKLLTISGMSGNVSIKGKNKDNPVNCGIVIAGGTIHLKIEDLNIRADNALVFEGIDEDIEYAPTLTGTNRLESTQGPGIRSDGNRVIINNGSLTVIGGNAAYGIQGKVYIDYNACVVAIDGEGASAGKKPYPYEDIHKRGLLISGTMQAGGSIRQDYSELKGNITLGGNLEIPEWATVTIADGQTFTIAPNVTLTNKGTIKNEGTLAGTPVVGNQPQHRITFKANDSESTADKEDYFLEGETLPTDIFTRSGYTFQGWFTDPDGGKKVETVTGAQTLYAQWEADKQPEPPYVPVYHSVYLPQVEGASTNPGPGKHEVESWDNFRFYLTIDSAYSESQPVVTTDRGETLVPRTSDGAYLVKYVRTDVEVFIDGLFKNPPPVANEAISTDALAPQIWTEGSMLCIRMAEALPSAPVRIFTVDGRLYDSFASTPGLNRRQLPTGIYIVRVGEETACKVIIK